MNSLEKTYSEWLEKEGYYVINRVKQFQIIKDLYLNLEDDCLSYFPD